MTHVTLPEFERRFVSLVLGGRSMPKKQLDQHVLLFSATIALDPRQSYSEKDLNALLQAWSEEFGGHFGLDHVTLRRYLVDAGYLLRDDSGAAYTLGESVGSFTFDESIRQLHLKELIAAERERREMRKRQYMK